MGWEIRKHAPSDNVMVPATSDPFESPKWAPPVWHMPPALVLLVNLARAFGRLVALLLRHPVASLTTAFGVWLTVVAGWTPLALLVASTAVGLAAWALFGWTSFVRMAVRPTRARWRLVMVYRRNWRPVMVMSGLAFYRNAREYLPTVKRVEVHPAKDRVLVKMLSGQAPAIWEDHAANLAHGFGAQSCKIRTATRPPRRPWVRFLTPVGPSSGQGWPGHIWLELTRTDTLATPITALPLPGSHKAVDLSALPVGRCEDGGTWRLRLAGTHLLVAGATGAGKGSVLWSIVRAVLPAVAAGWVSLWGIDPKRMELAFGRVIFNRYSDDPTGGMVALLEHAVKLMQDRAARFGGRTRTFTPTQADPFVIIIVDELAYLTAYSPDRDLRKRAEAAIATLTSQGRAVGVCVVGALQDPRKEVMNLRNLFPDRIALRLDESNQVDMVLGDGARDRGALADQISSIPAIGAGVGFVRLEATPDPVRVRAAYVTDTDITAMATNLVDLDDPPELPRPRRAVPR